MFAAISNVAVRVLTHPVTIRVGIGAAATAATATAGYLGYRGYRWFNAAPKQSTAGDAGAAQAASSADVVAAAEAVVKAAQAVNAASHEAAVKDVQAADADYAAALDRIAKAVKATESSYFDQMAAEGQKVMDNFAKASEVAGLTVYQLSEKLVELGLRCSQALEVSNGQLDQIHASLEMIREMAKLFKCDAARIDQVVDETRDYLDQLSPAELSAAWGNYQFAQVKEKDMVAYVRKVENGELRAMFLPA
jgi:uncharacterized protein YukE